MQCDGCGVDKTVTVTWGIALTLIDPRTGNERTVRRERRLCPTCGGALRAEDAG